MSEASQIDKDWPEGWRDAGNNCTNSSGIRRLSAGLLFAAVVFTSSAIPSMGGSDTAGGKIIPFLSAIYAYARCDSDCSHLAIRELRASYSYYVDLGLIDADSTTRSAEIDMFLGLFAKDQLDGRVSFTRSNKPDASDIVFHLKPEGGLSTNTFRNCKQGTRVEGNLIAGGTFDLYYDSRLAGTSSVPDLTFYQCLIYATMMVVDYPELNYLVWGDDPAIQGWLRSYWNALWCLRKHHRTDPSALVSLLRANAGSAGACP